MNAVKGYIMQADDQQLSDLLNTVLMRYRELFPGWELCVLSLNKQEDHRQQLAETIRLLEQMKAAVEE